MTLEQILLKDTERSFLTRAQRQAIRVADAELKRWRNMDIVAENIRLREELTEEKERSATCRYCEYGGT